MTAPALILLAQGSEESRVAQQLHTLRKQMQMMRSAQSIHLAFTDHCPPSGPQVVSTLVARGVREIVFVPLDLTRAIEPDVATSAMVAKLSSTYPDVAFGVSRPLGPATELLNIVDERLRAALRVRSSTELDGLVLSTPGNGDIRGHALVSRRARQWSTHHKLPCVVSVADSSGPNAAQAISALRAQGRRHIAVGSFFLVGDEAWQTQAELAAASGAEAVSAPFGCDERIMEIALGRYAYAAMDLLDGSRVASDTREFDIAVSH